jgi:hypothetical protein
MRKAKIISEIQAYLTEELQSLGESDAPRLRELQAQLTMYRFLPQREFGDEDVAVPGALVELELGGRKALYLIVPQGGGLVLSVEGEPVQGLAPPELELHERAGHRDVLVAEFALRQEAVHRELGLELAQAGRVGFP